MNDQLTRALWSADVTRRCLLESGGDVDAALAAAEYIVAQGPTQEDLAPEPIAPSINALLSHDISNPRAQDVLSKALKKSETFASDALKSLEEALDREGTDSGQAILTFVNEYHAKLADLLTDAQLSAALEGALEVADKVPQLDADAEAIARIYGHIPRPAFSTDAQGHQHKGKGPGGGQFTSSGGNQNKSTSSNTKSNKGGSEEEWTPKNEHTQTILDGTFDVADMLDLPVDKELRRGLKQADSEYTSDGVKRATRHMAGKIQQLTNDLDAQLTSGNPWGQSVKTSMYTLISDILSSAMYCDPRRLYSHYLHNFMYAVDDKIREAK